MNTLAFDVYGTLIDTHGVVSALNLLVGDRATDFSQTWRDKQLEYSFRRGLMQNYETFAVCTRQALEFTCSYFAVDMSSQQKDELMALYRVLPAYADAKDGLRQLKSSGVRLYAFSNGARDALDVLLGHAGLKDYFIDMVSVDPVKSFKPNPAVYAHFMRQSGITCDCAWMVSAGLMPVMH